MLTVYYWVTSDSKKLSVYSTEDPSMRFIGFANQMHIWQRIMMDNTYKQGSSGSSSTEATKSSKPLTAGMLEPLLRKLPIALPIRNRVHLVEANRLMKDPEVLGRMVRAVTKIVQWAFNRGGSKSVGSLVANTIIGRFDCVYLVLRGSADLVKRHENELYTEGSLAKVPMHSCQMVDRLFQRAIESCAAIGVADQEQQPKMVNGASIPARVKST